MFSVISTCPYICTLVYAYALQAMVGYFDVGFEQVPHLVHMSTSPQDEPTHWKQTVFYLAQPFQVYTGEGVHVRGMCVLCIAYTLADYAKHFKLYTALRIMLCVYGHFI